MKSIVQQYTQYQKDILSLCAVTGLKPTEVKKLIAEDGVSVRGLYELIAAGMPLAEAIEISKVLTMDDTNMDIAAKYRRAFEAKRDRVFALLSVMVRN